MAQRFTLEQYARLKEAYSLGATRVTYEDRTVEYRSLEEMRRLLGEIEADQGMSSSSRRILPSTRKDL